MTDERLAELQAIYDARAIEASNAIVIGLSDDTMTGIGSAALIMAFGRTIHDELAAEIRRLRRGDLTPEEFHARCHHRDERPGCTPLDFAEGCHQYSTQLFSYDNRVVVMRGELTKDVKRG